MKKFILILIFAPYVLWGQIINITSEDYTSWYKYQKDTSYNSSGTTCIAMIIDRWGPEVSAKSIRNQMNGRNLETFESLLKILNNYGIKFYYLFKLSKWNDDGILMINVDDSKSGGSRNHYMIIVGQTKDSYIVNDPAKGFPLFYYHKDYIRKIRKKYIIWIP